MTLQESIYIIYIIIMTFVILGHLMFAWKQWSAWCDIARELTDFDKTEIRKTKFLGRSIASYNASIGFGLTLSFLLDGRSEVWVQGVVLALICATAAVGASGTRGNRIIYFRFTPAAISLLLLIILQFI